MSSTTEQPSSCGYATLSALQMHRKAIIVCDEDATMELKVGTYRYFKDIESQHLDPATMM